MCALRTHANRWEQEEICLVQKEIPCDLHHNPAIDIENLRPNKKCERFLYSRDFASYLAFLRSTHKTLTVFEFSWRCFFLHFFIFALIVYVRYWNVLLSWFVIRLCVLTTKWEWLHERLIENFGHLKTKEKNSQWNEHLRKKFYTMCLSCRSLFGRLLYARLMGLQFWKLLWNPNLIFLRSFFSIWCQKFAAAACK